MYGRGGRKNGHPRAVRNRMPRRRHPRTTQRHRTHADALKARERRAHHGQRQPAETADLGAQLVQFALLRGHDAAQLQDRSDDQADSVDGLDDGVLRGRAAGVLGTCGCGEGGTYRSSWRSKFELWVVSVWGVVVLPEES